MNEHYDYLRWFFIFAWTPTIIIWALKWRLLIRYTSVLIICVIGSTVLAFPWDYWATHSWLWQFSPDHTLGIHFLGLPVEEFVFFTSETLLYGSLALVLRDYFKRKNLA